MTRKDKRIFGQHNSLFEPNLDMTRLRYERLEKVQREMAKRDIGALILTDIMNIRYCTAVSVMPLWTAVNLAHYVLVPVHGDPIIYEYNQSSFIPKRFWNDVRPAHYWQHRFADSFAPSLSDTWANEIKDAMRERGVEGGKLAVDNLDYYGFLALQKLGLTLADADEPMEAARVVKTPDEIELLRQAAAVCEAALFDMEKAIRPGITENELLAIFWHRMLAMGGEHCFTRLIASGHRTNPWFHEASSKMVRPGDLVGIDTDMIGPHGYVCDMSRTFLCGDVANPIQKEAYKIAYDFIQATIELCQVSVAFSDFANRVPKVPDAYKEQRYSVILHGIGTDDEPPFIPFIDDLKGETFVDGEFQENTVLSVEFYAGKVGEQEGVKLEEEILLTKDGPVVITLYPYEEKLLG
jgi:Xaa-Pro aminopeptidase